LLGWVAGDMALTDPIVKDSVDAQAPWLHAFGPAIGAALVVAIGKSLAMLRARVVEPETGRHE
jgi:hypothetical protein